MDSIGWAMIAIFATLVIGAFTYALIRLKRESHGDVSPKAKRLARLVLLPPIFDPLVAKALRKREIIGFLVLAIVMVVAITFF